MATAREIHPQPSLWRRALATLATAFDPAREGDAESVFQTLAAEARARGRDDECAAPKRRNEADED